MLHHAGYWHRHRTITEASAILTWTIISHRLHLSDYTHTLLQVSVESFALQAPDVSLALLLALWPLARHDPDIERYFVTVLRKAMYGRDVASRLFAMRGFLFVILEGIQKGASQRTSECSQVCVICPVLTHFRVYLIPIPTFEQFRSPSRFCKLLRNQLFGAKCGRCVYVCIAGAPELQNLQIVSGAQCGLSGWSVYLMPWQILTWI